MNSLVATALFTDMLVSLLDGGATVTEALSVLSADGIQEPVRTASRRVLVSMNAGASFSASVRGIGKTMTRALRFSSFHISLIEASERTGRIVSVLKDVSVDLRARIEANDSFSSALAYPVIVIAMALCGTIFLYAKGIPLLIRNGFLDAADRDFALGGIALALLFLLFAGTTAFYFLYRVFLRVSPSYVVFYVLAFMTENGIPIHEALSHCETGVTGARAKAAVRYARRKVGAGTSLSHAFGDTGFFPAFATGWLAVAEGNGNPSAVFRSLCRHFRAQDNRLKEIASRLIEPALIAITGVYISILIETVILPVLTLSGGLNVNI